MAEDHFEKYAVYYDALYSDKNYAEESLYLHNLLKEYLISESVSILEFGSGTGKHAIELCSLGNTVLGVEPSSQMIALAQGNSCFTLIEGDIRSKTKYGTFDACIAMFHVLSYLHTPRDLEDAFASAAKNLRKGGVFVFDVWHAPAVLSLGLENRTKEANGPGFSIRREATPTHFPEKHQVNVHYALQVSHDNGLQESFEENHLMRYFWPDEFVSAATDRGFVLRGTLESFSAREPSVKTWSVLYVFELR